LFARYHQSSTHPTHPTHPTHTITTNEEYRNTILATSLFVELVDVLHICHLRPISYHTNTNLSTNQTMREKERDEEEEEEGEDKYSLVMRAKPRDQLFNWMQSFLFYHRQSIPAASILQQQTSSSVGLQRKYHQYTHRPSFMKSTTATASSSSSSFPGSGGAIDMNHLNNEEAVVSASINK
jgi:hypothetical protein